MRRVQGRRLERLEARCARGCPTCRQWVGAVLTDDDGNLSRPEWCHDCGRYVPVTLRVHLVGVPLDAL
jgi:hypothetical protein